MGAFGVGLPRTGRPSAGMGGVSTQPSSPSSPPPSSPSKGGGTATTPSSGGSAPRVATPAPGRSLTPGRGTATPKQQQSGAGSRFPSAVGALSRTAAGQRGAAAFGSGRVPQKITDRVKMESLKALNPGAVAILQSQVQKYIQRVDAVSDDQLQTAKGTTVENSSYSPKERGGLVRFRPEILSVLDFLPLFEGEKGDGLTPAGQLLELQYQALVIRNSLLKGLMDEIKDVPPDQSSVARTLQDLGTEFQQGRARIRAVLDVYANWLEALDQYKRSLDVKTLPMFAFDTQRFSTLHEVFEKHLGFSRGGVNLWTDTKVLNQVLHDLGWVLDNYSPSLVNAEILGRMSDVNPVRISTAIDSVGQSLGFRPRQLASGTKLQRASESNWVSGFLNSLPVAPIERVKVLVTCLSKEIRVSRVLGNPATKTRLEDLYQTAPVGNPFDNVVGKPGAHILDDSLGPPTSLATLTQVRTGNSTQALKVLPFESKYFDDLETKRTFAPGAEYLVDSILENLPATGGFDTKPLTDFAGHYQKTVEEAKTTILGLLEVNRPQTPVQGLRMFQRFANSYLTSISGIVGSGRDLDQAVVVALFSLANQDQTLKNMLLEFCILVGLAGRQDEKNDKSFWKRVVGDYQTIQGFSFVKAGKKDRVVLSGASLGPWVQALAEDIESRVLELTRQSGVGLQARKVSLGKSLGGKTARTAASTKQANLLAGNNADKTSIPEGSLKDILMRCAQVSGVGSQTLVKAALDLAGSVDDLAGTPDWVLPDGSGRTRFHFWSTSTVAMVVFETLCSMVALFGGVAFQTKVSTANFMTLLFDQSRIQGSKMALEDAASRSPVQDPETYHDHLNVPALTTLAASPKAINPGIRSPGAVSARVGGSIRAAMGGVVGGTNSAAPSPGGSGVRRITGILGAGRSPGGSDIAGTLVREDATPAQSDHSSAPRTGSAPHRAISLAGTLNVIKSPPKVLGILNVLGSTKIVTNLTMMVHAREIADKVDAENRVVENLLHILEVVGKRLESASSQAVSKFNAQTLARFLQDAQMTLEDLAGSILLVPSQVRTSAYLYDWYTQRVTVSAAGENGSTVFVDDLPPPSRKDALTAWAKDSSRRGHLTHKNLKFFTIGLPAGLSDHLSDRVTFQKSGINLRSTDTDDKQFDLVSVNVYKRDARFDDLVWKPKKFLFDLSLFVPFDVPKEADSFPEDGTWATWVGDQVLRDYQSVLRPGGVTWKEIQEKAQYRFLGHSRLKSLWENHLQSEVLDLYIQFLTGATMSEDSFLENEVQLSAVVEGTMIRLVLDYLRDFKGKSIPNGITTAEEALANPGLDEETKDLVSLVSFGNLVFHTSYLKKNILGMKKFDRVFTIPVDTDTFEVDVPMTTSTTAGREMWKQEALQALLEHKTDGTVVMRPRTKGDIIFSDYFVVVEAVTG